MRTIKFRGIGKRTGTWIYGNLIQLGGAYIISPIYDKYEVVPDHSTEYALGFHEDEFDVIEPDSLGQFAGLLDKNGKEIYEGDYIEVRKNGFGGVVTWHPHGYFYIKELYKFKYDEEADCLPLGEFIYDTKCEATITIVDNMHDNPELLND